MRLARFLLLLCVYVSLSSEFSIAFARRVEECGIERTNYLRNSICAPEAFNVGTSMSCPGSVSADSFRLCFCAFEEKDCATRPQCTREGPCSAGYYQSLVPRPPRLDVYCVRDDKPATCRIPQFGVELYSACIPEIVWNDCSIRKTRVELDAFIDQTNRSLPVYGSLYVSNRALIAKLTSNANELACLVKNWDGNPLYVDLIVQMKNSYKSLTGQNYSESACRSDASETISCSPEDGSEVCVAQRNVDTARDFLKGNLDEINLLVTDVVPSSDPVYRQKLEELAVELAWYVK